MNDRTSMIITAVVLIFVSNVALKVVLPNANTNDIRDLSTMILAGFFALLHIPSPTVQATAKGDITNE